MLSKSRSAVWVRNGSTARLRVLKLGPKGSEI